ncbi:MAG: hypothetical protein M0T83_07135 [Nitrospiraceae bacterium]|nr:hypothetical protein [Nitrospiraceae bacterium]
MTTCLIDAPPGEDVLASFLDGPSGRTLSLRLAESASERTRAESLVARMYARMGYNTEGLLPEGPGYATLLLSEGEGEDLGTVTVGSGAEGLRAEESYPDEIAALRLEGRSLCEFNALAILPGLGSPFALARLFHAALLAGGPLLGHSDAVVEVNPTHVKFYERMLGFEKIGTVRACSRVKAPALLLNVNLISGLERARVTGGCPELRSSDRSLFPLFFNPLEAELLESRIAERLFSPARILRNRCIGSFPNFPEGERSGWYRSGHRPSVPA